MKIPKVQLAIYLSLIYLTALFYHPSVDTFLHLVTTLLWTVVIDLILLRIRKIKLFWPSASIVTGLIIALLIAPEQPFYTSLLAAFLAMASKNFLRIESRHLFNPAAFGLIAAGILLNFDVSWWGVVLQNLLPLRWESVFFPILLLPGLVSIGKLRRYGTVVSFLLVYFLTASIVSGDFKFFLNSLISPVVLFFALVMLPEPMTTPVNFKRQVLFGSFVALVSFFVNRIPFLEEFIPDSLSSALLLGNLLFFKFR